MEDASRCRGSFTCWWEVFWSMRQRRNEFLRYSLWTRAFSHLPKTLSWQALNYLHSSLPKLFKYVRSWSNRKAFGAYSRQSFPLWAVGDQTWKQGKNKGLSGLLKTPGPSSPSQFIQWNRHEIPADCKNLSNMSKLFCLSENILKPGDT